MKIRAKRVYDPEERGDGIRILVDKVWPRDMTKKRMGADLWMKGIAPSSELRKWFGHDPSRWDEFGKRYFSKLE